MRGSFMSRPAGMCFLVDENRHFTVPLLEARFLFRGSAARAIRGI